MHIPLGWILFTHTFLYEHTTKYRLLPFLFDNIYTVFLLLHLVVQQESPSLYCHPASDTMLRNTLPLRGQLWTSAGCANSSRSYVWELGALHWQEHLRLTFILRVTQSKLLWISTPWIWQLWQWRSAALRALWHDGCMSQLKKTKEMCFLSTWVGLSKAYVLKTLLC